MNLDNTLFDTIQLLAEESPRRRMHYDLRTEADAPAGVGHENWKDMSQRILNVMMPGIRMCLYISIAIRPRR